MIYEDKGSDNMSNAKDDCVIISIDGEDIEVDKHCADMVIFLNEIGMKTRMCCEGHGERAYKIWFDVDDATMHKFIEKTSKWTEVGVRPTNEDRTEFETFRFQRGLQGSIYKKYWYRNGKLIQDWIYQAEGGYDRHDYLIADRDLRSMKALYYGTDIEEIRREQQVMAEKRLGRLERAVARGTMPEPFQNSIQ